MCSSGYSSWPYAISMYIKLLVGINDSRYSFADGIQLQISAPPDKILELLRSMQSCISDVKVLATANMYLMLLTDLFNAV